MVISHQHKILFIHIHRTGGSTIINLLQQQLGAEVRVVSQHGNARTSESELLEHHPEYFTFGFVRNPWARLLSWYALLNKWNPTDQATARRKFEAFLTWDKAAAPADPFFHYNQLDYFTTGCEPPTATKIYRYENYAEETHRLFACLGFPLAHIPVMNATAGKDYRDYYTARSIELVREKCQRDLDYFQYDF